jgi:hypothetical protein
VTVGSIAVVVAVLGEFVSGAPTASAYNYHPVAAGVNSLLRRQGEHFRDPRLSDYAFEVVARTDVYAHQRGLEQLVHDAYNPALNRINRSARPIRTGRGISLRRSISGPATEGVGSAAAPALRGWRLVRGAVA